MGRLVARPPLGIVVALLAGLLLVPGLLLHSGPADPGGPPVSSLASPRCLVISDSTGRSSWVATDTLVLTATPAPWGVAERWHQIEGRQRRVVAPVWRPLVGDSLELADHHQPRVRFAVGERSVGVETWPESSPLILAPFVREVPHAHVIVRQVPCAGPHAPPAS